MTFIISLLACSSGQKNDLYIWLNVFIVCVHTAMVCLYFAPIWLFDVKHRKIHGTGKKRQERETKLVAKIDNEFKMSKSNHIMEKKHLTY